MIRSVDAASLGIRFAFLMFVCGVILTGVLRDRVVTVETIAGAASVYLLFGVAWACLFGLIAMLRETDAELFNRACVNHPTLVDLYKYAAYDAIVQRMTDRPIASG